MNDLKTVLTKALGAELLGASGETPLIDALVDCVNSLDLVRREYLLSKLRGPLSESDYFKYYQEVQAAQLRFNELVGQVESKPR